MEKKKAELYRMVTPDHLCPWGVKALDILKRHNFEVADHHLESMDASQQFKEDNDVDETPQIFIEGDRLGGYDELREHLGLGPDPEEGETYKPIVAIFGVTALMAVVTSRELLGEFSIVRTIELFIAFSMCALGIQKLRDLKAYATGFVQYDLLAQRYVPYAYVYAFIEAIGGALMITGLFIWLVGPIVLIASAIGAVSIIKAVYLEKRDLKCACVGGDSSVPLGFISLTENLMMMAMAIWMMVQAL